MSSELFEHVIPLLPEAVLLLGALLLLLVGVFRMPRVTRPMLFTTMFLLLTPIFLLPGGEHEPVIVFNGMFLADGFTAFTKVLVLGGAALTLLFSMRWLMEDGGKPFEYLLVTVLAVTGMMLMISANDLIALYLGLELASLSQYILAAFNRDDARSSEAGLKYFMLGALASGMLLFGMSFIYGFTGVTGFDAISQQVAAFSAEGATAIPQVISFGMVLIIVGFCFKLAAVPFHMWTPDVYEGAPTPSTAFFAVASKIAVFAIFSRVLLQLFGDLVDQWQQILIFISLASMAVGALAALRQTNIKRLLAYSSISHAGFMLMGLASGTGAGVQAMLIYLALYLFMSAGAFGCVLLMKRDGYYVEAISDLSGLSKTNPGLAFVMAAFMFSLAGIPPLAGFFGKLYVVLAAVEAGLVWLAVIGMLTSVISCYYYLRVVKFMYFDEPQETLESRVPFASRTGLAISAVVILLFFLAPSPLINQAKAAAAVLLH